ncbi:MAG: NAD(+) diphosphatase [Pseudomonadota bacterium]
MSVLSSITFAGAALDPAVALDRAAHRRGEAAALAALPEARSVLLSEGRIATRLDGPAKVLARRAPGAGPVVERAFLGLDAGAPLFAEDLGPMDDDARLALLGETGKFIDLRSIAPDLTTIEGEIAATARALLGWHARHRFCANCGASSAVRDAGWRRACPSCGASHFPRVDPVVIMLVTREDHVLVGRQSSWPPGLHSLLAGYVEPGETPENAVRREVMEEAAIPVGRVRYLATQPWPFPSTLMLGFAAEALAWDITADTTEIESARWVPRAEMAEALAGRHPGFMPPRPDAIARALIAAWIAGEIPDF